MPFGVSRKFPGSLTEDWSWIHFEWSLAPTSFPSLWKVVWLINQLFYILADIKGTTILQTTRKQKTLQIVSYKHIWYLKGEWYFLNMQLLGICSLMLSMCSLVQECVHPKDHHHRERPQFLLAGWIPILPAFLSSSVVCSLILELDSPTSEMMIFWWCNTESVQDVQVWHESMGSIGLIIIDCIQSVTVRGTRFNWRHFPTLGQWYHRRNKAIYHEQVPYCSAHQIAMKA